MPLNDEQLAVIERRAKAALPGAKMSLQIFRARAQSDVLQLVAEVRALKKERDAAVAMAGDLASEVASAAPKKAPRPVRKEA